MPVSKLLRVSLTVADLDTAANFYAKALGLEVGNEEKLGDPVWCELLGLEQDTEARARVVTIGDQTLKLIAFEPKGWSYPQPYASNEQWFEHVALVAGDIASVWRRLEKASPMPITEGEPVTLPSNTGGVTAFKFRDACGHPLELISFPQGVGDPRWQQGGKGIRGYDHTAIAVAELEASLEFYTGVLGMEEIGRSLNQGHEQDRLDGLPEVEVDVVALAPPGQKTPHLELLHYRNPPGRTLSEPVSANDVASARQVYEVEDLEAMIEQVEKKNLVSPGIVTVKSGQRAAAIRDPDCHMIVLLD